MASMGDETCRICRSEGTPEEPLYHPCKCSGSIKYVHQECLLEWLQHSQKKHCELCKTSFRFTKVYDPHMPKTLPFLVFLKLAFKHLTRLVVQILRLSSVLFVWLFWLPWTVRTIWRFYFYVADGGPLFEGGSGRPGLSNSSSANVSMPGTPSFMGLIGPDIASSIVVSELSSSNSTTQDRISDYLLPPTTFRIGAGLANLTASAQINQILVDTFEGQIITILVVLAFILIFLIREWVVQQQPPQALDGNGQPVQQQDPRFDELLAEIERHRARREANGHIDDENANGPAPQPMFESGDEAEGEDNTSEESVFGGNNSELSFRAGRNEESDGEMPFRFEEPAQVPTAELTNDLPLLLQEPTQDEQQPSDINFDLRGLTEYSYSDNEASTSSAPVLDRRPIYPMRKRKGPQAETSVPPAQPEESPFTFQNTTSSAPFQFGSSSRASTSTDSQNDALRRPQISRELSAMAAELRRAVEERRKMEEMRLHRENQVPSDVEEEDEPTGQLMEISEDTPIPTQQSDHQIDNSDLIDVTETQVPVATEADAAISKSYSFDLSSSGSDFNWNKYTEYTQQTDQSTSAKGKAAVVGTRESSSGSDVSRKRASDMSWEELAEMKGQNSKDASGDEGQQVTSFDDASSEDDIDFHDQVQREILARAAERYGDFDGRLSDRIRNTEPISVEEMADLVRTSHTVQPQPQETGNSEAAEPAELQDPDVLLPGFDAAPRAPTPPIPVVVNPPPQAPAVLPPGGNEALANGVADDDVDVDVDDFDGVMELIGMRGPLMALVQNGIFSAVLISATIGIGVWVPYMWGRMVLMILSNPLGFFITLPYKAVIFTIELFIDLAIMFGSFLVYFSDLSGRCLLVPAGWVFPYINKAVRSRTTADLTQKLAAEANGRIAKSVTSLVNYMVSMRSLQHQQAIPPIFKWQTGQSLDLAFGKIAKTADVLGFNGTDVLLKLRQWQQPNVTETLVNMTAPVLPNINDTISGNSTFIQELAASKPEVVGWTPLDRIITVIAGYVFISVVGAFYLQHKKNLAKKGIYPRGIDRKIVEGLGQAGSVMKVVLIIGIEMFVFPLYCGFLLDLALLPLFEHATIWNRWLFLKEFIFTSLFVHWFIGTCYMFHFALFVSMCRNIMRDGVLYFIRDPDDPTFHPVKEVLERPVTTQLKKIGFSAIIYGVLVIMFLGGVVWALHYSFLGLLPVHWSSNEPVLEFPVDLLFYNIFMPIAIKYFRPANILETIYGWWFRQCAKVLRLSSFMFGDRRPEEEGIHIRKTWVAWLLRRKGAIPPLPAVEGEETKEVPITVNETETGAIFQKNGRFVRAPAKDSVRPSRENLFIAVNEKNERVDGRDDPIDGDFGPNSENVTLVYLPPNFRTRIGLVICMIWFFTACTGAAVTVGPLVFGRFILGMMLPGSLRMNDLYAFSLGLYALGAVVLIASSINAAKDAAAKIKSAVANLQAFRATAWLCTVRALKILYVLAAFVVVLPTLFAFVIEAYIILPLHTYFSTDNNHVIHFIQDWTLGVLYVKMLGRMILLDRDSALSRSLRAIVANGYLNPNVGVATKKFVLPAGGAMLVALFAPLTIGFIVNTFIVKGASPELSHQIYRYSYPALLVVTLASVGLFFLYRLFDSWKQSLRDEIYLVGEQLHNHGDRRLPEAPSTAPVVPEAEPLINEQEEPNMENGAFDLPVLPQEQPGLNDEDFDDRPNYVLERMDSSVQTAAD
ncbi:hypothetical protein H072_4758 [Dactylellina haptotyla CBS 200.50]|uniref:RING-type E3 ubiquitin transferase n=1 Tax=Dactylellina haptotyla (strain CBS 200.50) TaxID=1284197 RepID=S8AEL0_DACHA|nr:hypothetical protein H072_4758 [Dactylellina haptotyla CBS 200.50]